MTIQAPASTSFSSLMSNEVKANAAATAREAAAMLRSKSLTLVMVQRD